jgi:hypothetical protein
MAVVAVNLFDPKLAQTPTRQSRQIGQPFAGPQGLEELLRDSISLTKSRPHIIAHFKGLRSNARPKPHQNIFRPGLTHR